MCNKRSSVNGIVRGKKVRLDSCLRSKIEVLNNAGLHTVASCCGHGRYYPSIVFRSKVGTFYTFRKGTRKPVIIPRTRNFYRMDSEGFYFIPELCQKNSGKETT